MLNQLEYLQMVVALIGSYSKSANAHFHPYVSEFEYAPRNHPSRNPDCVLQWFGRESHEGEFDRMSRRHSSLEEPLIPQQDRPWIEIRAVLARDSKTRKEM